jgi:protein-S-isoprenylcysteine O-methyltransferase Ste14
MTGAPSGVARTLDLKVPPVAIAFACALAMWLARLATPGLTTHFNGRALVGAAIAATGVALAVAGVITFRTAATTVDPTHPERSVSLVTRGPYRCSRNPMYLGMALLLAGWAAFLANAASLAGLPLFVAYLNRWQIEPEERALADKFGEEFENYRKRVRRWL